MSGASVKRTAAINGRAAFFAPLMGASPFNDGPTDTNPIHEPLSSPRHRGRNSIWSSLSNFALRRAWDGNLFFEPRLRRRA
jgi:hypothetical protein